MSKLVRSEAWASIPDVKMKYMLHNTLKKCEECKDKESLADSCRKCSLRNESYRRYLQANIPLRYWNLSMKEDYKGDPGLLDLFNRITEDLEKTYQEGLIYCLAGKNGVGKTLCLSSILKTATLKGFTALYVTLSDIVSVMVSAPMQDKHYARRELLEVDFLVIDEFDPRYMPTESASDLFGRAIEDTLRKRAENQLPLFMSTNSPNVIDSFEGAIKTSIDSLMNYAEIFPVLGKDFRKGSK